MPGLIKSILNITGWVLLTIGFVFYLRYQEIFVHAPRVIVFLGTLILIIFGLGLILFKSYASVRRAKREGTIDKIARITPLDEFKHDVIALLTSGLILAVASFSKIPTSLDVIDFMQAGIGFLGVIALRHIYLK